MRSSCACGKPLATPGASQCRPCRAAYMREHRPKHSELPDDERRRANCRAHTNVLIRRGILVRQPCEACGAPAALSEVYHSDYAKPKQVNWFCRTHRLELQGKLRRLAKRAA